MRRRAAHPVWRAAMPAVVVAVVVAGLLATPAPGSAAPAGDSWHVAATLGLGTEHNAVSCATSQDCWAIEGGELLSSSDGGASWSTRTSLVPAGVSALDDIACPRAGRCYLTGVLDGGAPTALVLRDGTLSTAAIPATQPVVTVSCPAAARCLASDGTAVYLTTDGAASWTTYSLPQIVYSFAALGCVTGTRTCWIVGDNGEQPLIQRTTSDGRHWTPQQAPSPIDGLHDVACPTTTTCFAVGAKFSERTAVISTSDSGATWTFDRTPRQVYPLRSVACATRTTCWAAGLDAAGAPFVFATTTAGHRWVAQDLPSSSSGGAPQLSCPTASSCTAVSGGVTFATTDAGATWTETQVPAAPGAPAGLSCPSSLTCVGVSNDALGRPTALTSDDGGASWQRHDMPAAGYGLWDLDCPDTSTCLAIANGVPGRPGATVTHVLSSVDGGLTWHKAATLPATVLRVLSCPAATTCLAAGFDRQSRPMLVVTTDGGATWQTVPPPPGAFYLQGVSCSATDACVLITRGTSGPTVAWTTSDLGTTYQQHQLPYADADYASVSCADQTCVTVGFEGGDGALAVSTDGGRSWVAGNVPLAAQSIERVSCGSATACAATAFDFSQDGGPLIVGTTDAGAHWRAFAVPAGPEQPLDVACAGAACIASDSSASGNPIILAGRA